MPHSTAPKADLNGLVNLGSVHRHYDRLRVIAAPERLTPGAVPVAPFTAVVTTVSRMALSRGM